jgi:hypothetical protein
MRTVNRFSHYNSLITVRLGGGFKEADDGTRVIFLKKTIICMAECEKNRVKDEKQ